VLEPGKGYLVRSPEDRTKEIEGTTVDISWDTIKGKLTGVWSLIGPGSYTVEIGDASDIGAVYRWDDDHWHDVLTDETPTLEPGKAYWILKQPPKQP